MAENDFREIPTIEQSMCFGCGPSNEHGIKMKFYGNDKIIYSNVIIPEHMIGWKNLVHGGIISIILDDCMGRCAMFHYRKLVFTKSMTINYLKPVIAGDMLKVESEIQEHINDRDVSVLGKVFDGKGKLCASSTSTVSMLDTEFVKKLGIMDDQDLKDFLYMLNVRYDEAKNASL